MSAAPNTTTVPANAIQCVDRFGLDVVDGAMVSGQ